MAKIIVYNNDTDRMEIYYRDLSEAMPYNTGRTLTVREFRGASRKQYFMDDKERTMTSWNSGQKKIVWRTNPSRLCLSKTMGGRSCRAIPTLCWNCFDVGQLWTNAQRATLRNSAKNSAYGVI